MNTPISQSISRRALLGGAAAGTAALLTGCGLGSGGRKGRHIRFLVMSSKVQTAIQAGLGPDFTKRTGITIEYLLPGGGGNWQDVDSKLSNQFAAGTPPTMATVGANSMYTYAEAGLLQPLDALMADNGFRDEDQIPAFRQVGRYQGQTVAALCRLAAMVFSYNLDVFEKAGLDPNSPPTTWSEMRQASQAIVSGGHARYGAVHSYDADANWSFENFINWAGGSMMDPERRRFTFTDEPGVRALSYWSELIADGYSRAATNDEMNDAFLRQDAAMVFGPSNKPKQYGDEARFRFRTTVAPIPDGGGLRIPPGGGSLVIFSEDRDEQQACWEVISAIIGAAGQTSIAKVIGDVPVSVAATGPNYLGPLLVKQPYRQASLDSVQYLVPRFQFPGTRASQINDLLKGEIYAALTGVKSAERALSDAARRGRLLLPRRPTSGRSLTDVELLPDFP
ncbi:extracellular solute-binding protein [Mycolicibacterium farcinogenes]|nr:extracellular solute-binding protein [Mycolicibacterium farcinogenes]